ANGKFFSPARIGTVSEFSRGGKGHTYSSLYAQYGLYARLKSITYSSVGCSSMSRYRLAPYVSLPDVASRNGRKRLSSAWGWPGWGSDLNAASRCFVLSSSNSRTPERVISR